MRTASLLAERPALPVLTSAPTPPERGRRGRLGAPVLAMVSGVVVLVVAASLVLDRQRAAPAGTPSLPPAAAVDSSAITVSARDISVVSQVYGPVRTAAGTPTPASTR
ncbi:MAG: hypothetical protein M3450_13900 [Actinomycetota bacterium]|nr:hypothetical protein [Actinomycetota bacterium]